MNRRLAATTTGLASLQAHRRLVGALMTGAGILLLARPAAHVATAVRAQSSEIPKSSSPARPFRKPVEGEALGRLEVPRLGLDLIVFEGTTDATLQKGPGHLVGTAWPAAGERGNCVIAGHRDTFFRRLASARPDDLVRLHGPSGASTYRLETRRIVLPGERSVIAPTSDARLTLITCYPFGFTGSAPYRLVWNAVRLEGAPIAR
jgi:sortase A